MPKPGKQIPMIARYTLPAPDSTCPSDSESEIVQELEAKRLSIDEEISRFRVEKEKEFRDFEKELRSNRKNKQAHNASRQSDKTASTISVRTKRTSSSSALELLAGHGASKSPLISSPRSEPRNGTHQTKKNPTNSKAGPSPSKPTLLLEPLNVKGETLSQSQYNPPATPTSLTQTLSHASLSSLKDPSCSPKSPVEQGLQDSCVVRTPSNEAPDSFLGVLTPAYLPLLEPESTARNASSSGSQHVLVNGSKHASGVSITVLPDNVLPLQSSSFPPHVITLVPTSPTTKRAYTAPAATRMPSALRSASVGNFGRKRKHVTFRLADSVIVDPSSSYEEGSSPDQMPAKSKSSSAVSHSSRKNKPYGFSNVSPRNGLIGDHTRSDEEDEAAGVKPGMSMDEVMQKLNAQLDLEDHEDVGWTDTKYHEEESDEELSMDNSTSATRQDNDDEDDEDEVDDDDDDFTIEPRIGEDDSDTGDSDSYFSPKQHEIPTEPFGHSQSRSIEQHSLRDRSGSSPLTPLRDQNWDALSSSDKDRLLFAGRGSDSDSDHHQRPRHGFRRSAHLSHDEVPRHGLSGLKKTNSTNSLASLTSLKKLGSTLTDERSRKSHQPNFEDDLSPSIDGGSGIGFFELDEELASPHARQVGLPPSDNDMDVAGDADHDMMDRSPRAEAIKSEILGTGMASVPINIVRPSVSVSSSWVGTFGH